MKIIRERNILLENPETKPFLADAFYPETHEKLPLVIFVHGYKGYKDWGAWNLMAEKFAENGFFFIKFNFSYNGTSIENPSTFDQLENFGQNNYSKELSDLAFMINHFIDNQCIDKENVTLIGHSRGGGISIIQASEDAKIKSLVTLASVDSLDRFPKGKNFENWKEQGVFYSLNGRTKQEMPHYFQFFEDFYRNRNRFNVENAVKNFKGNLLIIHGTQDEAVPYSAAENLHLWNPDSQLLLIEGANHTFGAKEPWEKDSLPKDLGFAIEKTIHFLKTTTSF